jgi:hypothetical protein
MEVYVSSNAEKSRESLIACAAGSNIAFQGNSQNPISIYYYVLPGAESIQLFEADKDCEDPSIYLNYSIWNLAKESLFQGQMGRFKSSSLAEEKWVIVTYIVDKELHISDPIYLDVFQRPTKIINSKIQITETGVTPHFDWATDQTLGNVIYFSLVTDSSDQFISGTYTTDKFWTFYDLSNVTLNVTPTPNPNLMPSNNYRYIHMGVDEDNWVRTFGDKGFLTN